MSSNTTALQIKVNDEVLPLDAAGLLASDIIHTPDGAYHMLIGQQSVQARILQADMQDRKFLVEVKGRRYEVKIEHELDQVLEKMGFGKKAEQQQTEIFAPMPGLVLDIFVTTGQQVAPGEKLMILEAMKMENSIVSPGPATIGTIAVEKGQSVEKGQLLISFTS